MLIDRYRVIAKTATDLVPDVCGFRVLNKRGRKTRDTARQGQTNESGQRSLLRRGETEVRYNKPRRPGQVRRDTVLQAPAPGCVRRRSRIEGETGDGMLKEIPFSRPGARRFLINAFPRRDHTLYNIVGGFARSIPRKGGPAGAERLTAVSRRREMMPPLSRVSFRRILW